MSAFGYSFDDMVAFALDGVTASWLPADDAHTLRRVEGLGEVDPVRNHPAPTLADPVDCFR